MDEKGQQRWGATIMAGNSGNNKRKPGESGKGREFRLAPIATKPCATAGYYVGLTNMGTI